jgi:hypothetical protein
VERFVTALGGRVWVESAPGLGAVFSFTVPRAVVPAPGDGETLEAGGTAPLPPAASRSPAAPD